MSNYLLTYWVAESASDSVSHETLSEALSALIEQDKSKKVQTFDIAGAGEAEAKELAYWRLCHERAEMVAARVREKVGDQPVSSLPLALIYYERCSYRCHRCGMHWRGKGTLFPCAHPRKSVCKTCQWKCAIDELADYTGSWRELEAVVVGMGYTIEYVGQTIQIGTPSSRERDFSVAVFPLATGYEDVVRWLRFQVGHGKRQDLIPES